MPNDNKIMDDAKTALGMLKDITPILERWAEATPPEAKLAAQPGTASFDGDDAYDKMCELRTDLLKLSEPNLYRMIGHQLAKGAREGLGVPLQRWLGGSRSALEAMSTGPDGQMLTKLLDTGGGAALIRQDIEPMLYAAFVRRFPLWERLARIPSNGLVHAYNRVDAAPNAQFISELGTVSDGTGTYTRATSNIAIGAIRVGVGLKQMFAVQAGGGGWNPETEELRNGMTGLARKFQRTLIAGNASIPGKTADDPEGFFDINSFDGLRGVVPAANTLLHDSSLRSIVESLNLVDGLLSVTGGRASIIVMDARDRITWINELQSLVRVPLPTSEVVPGFQVQTASLGNSGDVPILPVPGDEMGHYDEAAGGTDVRDAYLLDESVISIPWLGSESPTILDIPIGISGTLTHVFILFQMAGLAVKVPNHIAKLQLPWSA